ncbi:MAG: hypothetical protein MJ058_00470 [Akkermansia sp.]|nr:hypothetical protein [Akkermansia sp.]
MNITTFEEMMAVLKIVEEKGYSILLDDRVADLRDDRIENDFHFLDPDTFRDGGYDIEQGKNGCVFYMRPSKEGELLHWIDIIWYQRLRVGDLSRGEIEIEPMELN